VEFAAVVGELYRLPPTEFTAARDRRVNEARAAGDRELSQRIGRLRKPTASAWLANLLVREQPEQLEQLLELGAAMREAQQSLSGEALKTLSRQRHSVIAALGREARRLAAATGHPVGPAAGVELEETLNRALADEPAAKLLREGRLTTALSPDAGGFGLATGPPPRQPAGPIAAPMITPPGMAAKPGTGQRDRRAAQQVAAADAVRRAEQDTEHAERTSVEAADAVQRHGEEAADLRRRLRELEGEVQRVRAEESLAQRELTRLQAQSDAAVKGVDAARRRLAQSRARMDRLADPR